METSWEKWSYSDCFLIGCFFVRFLSEVKTLEKKGEVVREVKIETVVAVVMSG